MESAGGGLPRCRLITVQVFTLELGRAPAASRGRDRICWRGMG